MSWIDRLRPEIKFVSPSGLKFSALWRGNDISAEKRLGRFAYPNIDREVIQDMGMNSRDIPLTVYFTGADHDIDARAFERALYEPETWQITHPVYGYMRLQLVSYKLAVEPVESGNISIFEIEWIEPADDDATDPIPDPAAEVETAVEAVNEASVADMAAVKQETISQGKAIANAIKKGVNAVKGVIHSVDAAINAAQRTINNLVNETYLDIAAISGGIISLIETPALMYSSLSSKIAMFQNLGNRIKDDFSAALDLYGGSGEISETKAVELGNTALTAQFFLDTVTAAMATAIISEPAETRREALSVLNEYRQFTAEAQAALDRAAKMTANNRIENQYVARAQSGEAIATLNAAVGRYVLGSLFSLKIERRLTLDRPRAPLELAITEYKATGESADYYYDFLCRTNHLHGRELLLLPTGREVVIYG